jgi:REP element-mobilizing transposase RayT
MPRPLRIQLPDAVYYVTNRGQGSQRVFEDATDARSFMALLEEIAVALGWRFHAYCLMTNHYHLVIHTPEPNLSAGMQVLAARYTQGFNRRHDRDGPLFHGRFRAILFEREAYLVPLVRYVVLNPVLANLAPDPAAWRWSSYRATAGTAPAPALIDLSWMVGRYGLALPEARQAWRADIAGGLAGRDKVQALEALLKNRSILGSRDFVRGARRQARKQPLAAKAKKMAAPGPIGGSDKRSVTPLAA